MERIVLIGFMGSGKTTLGRALAAALQVPFVDLDDEIEARAGCRVAELFTTEGEAGFRRRELDALAALTASAPPRCVVATGGGIVESPAARALLRALGRIVWLEADPAACIARVAARVPVRPLLGPGSDWPARWERRAPLYRELASAAVRTHPERPSESLTALAALAATAAAEG